MEYETGQANRLGNRDRNEDRFAVVEHDGAVLLVLADGLGGHAGGEQAAETFVETARQVFSSAPVCRVDAAPLFRHIVVRAHESIARGSADIDPAARPGTTGVLCLVHEGEAVWAHVGDSRVYLFRNNLPLYRTEDHSYVGSLYRRGIIDHAERATHPLRGHVTQCIGCHRDPPRVSIGRPVRLHEGDVLLLCSDGLWGPVDDATMGAGLGKGTLDEAVQRLAATAEDTAYPNSDNISVVALRFLRPARRTANARAKAVADRARKTGTGAQRDELRQAIDQIEDVIRQYADEMDRD